MHWRNLSIGRKLMLITLLSSAVALLFASVGSLAYDLVAFRQRLGRELMTAAEMIGSNSTAALTFDDPREAAEVLTALRAKPEIETAVIYTPKGQVFARYLRPGADPSFLGEDLPVDRNHLEVVHGIVLNGKTLGTLYVRSDMREWYGRLKSYLIIGGSLMLGWALLGLLLLLGLQRVITGPVLGLAATMRMVSIEKNYSLRATKANEDEIGALIDGFNGMLSEIQQRDAALLKRTAELEAANRELEAFSYTVSHDLRAPLRAMDGFSRILLEDYAQQLQPEAQGYLKRVCANAQRMGDLVDDLLTFARLSRQALNKQEVAPANLVRQSLEDLRAEQGGRRIEVTVGELPACQADPDLLKQVFINLLANALKFTRTREAAVIEVGSIWIEDSGLKVSDATEHPFQSEISILQSSMNSPIYFIRDNGVGFDMQYADKLFGVFRRLHRAEDYEGTGIGLATVQRIIHRHGGCVWAEAEVDRGATFFFTIEDSSSETTASE